MMKNGMMDIVKKETEGKVTNLSDRLCSDLMLLNIILTTTKRDPSDVYSSQEYYEYTKDFESYKGLIYDKSNIKDLDGYYNPCVPANKEKTLIYDNELSDPKFKAMILALTNVYLPSRAVSGYERSSRYDSITSNRKNVITLMKRVLEDDDIDSETVAKLIEILLVYDSSKNAVCAVPESKEIFCDIFNTICTMKSLAEPFRNLTRLGYGHMPSILIESIDPSIVSFTLEVLGMYRKSDKYNPDIERACLSCSTLNRIANDEKEMHRMLRDRIYYSRSDSCNLRSVIDQFGFISISVIDNPNVDEYGKAILNDYNDKIIDNFMTCINTRLSYIFSTKTMGALRRSNNNSFSDTEIKGFELINQHQDKIENVKFRKSIVKYYVDFVLQ